MCKKHTADERVDQLLNGRFESGEIEELRGLSALGSLIVSKLVDRVRPMDMRVSQLEVQLRTLKTRLKYDDLDGKGSSKLFDPDELGLEVTLE